jgi:hypothetical protein
VKSDPFAPANSPRHPVNLDAAFARAGAQVVNENSSEVQRWQALTAAHLTDHERRFWEDQDGYPPSSEELERRATLVEEYRAQLAEEGPDAEAPTLVDITGELYTWREGDRTEDDAEEPSGQPDGETSSGWYFVGEPEEDDPAGSLAIPPRNGPGSDTDTWRAFASAATSTEPSEWATMTRGEIIAHLEQDKVIPSEQA